MMEYANPHALVSTDWLAGNLDQEYLVILDASWHLAAAGRDAKAEFTQAHISGAGYFDIDDIADPQETKLPHMIPPADVFGAKVGALGAGNNSKIVVYDVYGGGLAAARAWWMFRLFGHDNVAMLNGGLGKWQTEDRPMDATPPAPAAKQFQARLNPALVCSVDQVMDNLETAKAQVLDARGPGRFNGTEPEARPGVRSGHIPGSINLPFQLFLDASKDLTLRPADELQAVFEGGGIDSAAPIISSCGSGVTACVAILALYLLGHDGAAVYDGSWTQWGGATHTPIEV